MEAKELRIGNYVTYMFDVDKIESIGDQTVLINNNYNPVNLINIHSIPLTEEWLLKFGFDHIKGFNYFERNSLRFEFVIDTYNVIYYNTTFKEDIYLDTEIKYVHQLQNLYYALTGKELEIQN